MDVEAMEQEAQAIKEGKDPANISDPDEVIEEMDQDFQSQADGGTEMPADDAGGRVVDDRLNGHDPRATRSVQDRFTVAVRVASQRLFRSLCREPSSGAHTHTTLDPVSSRLPSRARTVTTASRLSSASSVDSTHVLNP